MQLPNLPPNLSYTTYSEFNTNTQSPALTICLNTPTHNLLSIAIPYDTLPVLLHAPTMTLNQELTLYPTMTDDPPTVLSYAQTQQLYQELTESIIRPIERTINVYRTLHGTAGGFPRLPGPDAS